jgi:hypothetical protein
MAEVEGMSLGAVDKEGEEDGIADLEGEPLG